MGGVVVCVPLVWGRVQNIVTEIVVRVDSWRCRALWRVRMWGWVNGIGTRSARIGCIFCKARLACYHGGNVYAYGIGYPNVR